MKVITKMVLKMVKGNINGPMVHSITVSWRMIECMVMELISGLMVVNSMDNGEIAP